MNWNWKLALTVFTFITIIIGGIFAIMGKVDLVKFDYACSLFGIAVLAIIQAIEGKK